MSSRTPLTRSSGRSGVVRRIAVTLSILAMTLSGLIGVSAIAAQSASAAATQSSVAPCTARTDLTPFVKWGDDAEYFLIPNGGFNDGDADWSLSGGATVNDGGEPYNVVSGDLHNLMIPYGSQAVSETMCVTRGEDDVRLFVDNPGVQGSILHVEALVQNPETGLTLQTAFDVDGNAAPVGWNPSMILAIPNLLGGIGTQNLTLIFSTRGSAATWNIDDVFVDPFKST